MAKVQITERHMPFLGEVPKGSAFLSAERKDSPLIYQHVY